jgi:hypothetical protein
MPEDTVRQAILYTVRRANPGFPSQKPRPDNAREGKVLKIIYQSVPFPSIIRKRNQTKGVHPHKIKCIKDLRRR